MAKGDGQALAAAAQQAAARWQSPGTRTLPPAPHPAGCPDGGLAEPAAALVREIRINYGSGRYYNTRPRRFAHHGPPRCQVRLHQQNRLVLDLPTAEEAIVPHRSGELPLPAPTTA